MVAPTSLSTPFGLVGLCATMLAIPLAVHGSAAGPFDDPKAWALPILVALTGLGWLIDRREDFGPGLFPFADRATRWMAGTVGAYALWWVVTALVAVGPVQSVFGNFGRGLGLVAFGSAILLFPLVGAQCRSSASVRTVLDAVLLGSAPVCLLGLGQAVGWDPLPKAWDPFVRSLAVRSTFGQHIFLGSYLVTIIPLTAARLAWGWHERQTGDAETSRQARRGRAALAGAGAWVTGAVALVGLASTWAPAWWLLVPWGVIGALVMARTAAPGGPIPLLPVTVLAALLGVQVLVVILAQARGALLGMLAGGSVAALVLFARQRAWKALASVVTVVLVVTLAIALLNVPASPLGFLRDAPLLSRLSRIADVERGTPGWFRLQVWRATLDGWHRQLRGEAVIPGVSPRVRSLVGYGLESQLATLDRLALPALGELRARGEGWQAQYVVDRAHNVVLDHLVTAGLVGVGLWALLVGSLLTIGVARARRADAPGERAVRIGALGTIIAHVVEGQVGIASPMPLAIFWMAAALCTVPSWDGTARAPAPTRRPHRAWWVTATVAMILGTVLLVWFQTRWLLGSMAYADGVREVIAGRSRDAYDRFQRARTLVPLLPLPAEAAAGVALRLAGAETDAARRLAVLREADAILDTVRGQASSGTYWTLRAQVAFAEVRTGDRTRLSASLDAFDQAARLRPQDAPLLAQWAWALLHAGDAARARATAERALATAHGEQWLAWAVLARAARQQGDAAAAERAAVQARSLAPPQARSILDPLL